jgi:hypothetical protein
MSSIISNCIFGYQCNKSWDALDETQDPTIKHCNKCDKKVFFCSNPEALMQAIRDKKCVAIDLQVEDKERRLLGYPSDASLDLPKFLRR